MNWLAHLFLADPHPESLIGNLLGDFLRGVDQASLRPAVREGIARHREVDALADAHPAFRRSRARLAPPFRRWSGVVVDVFGDHFLARGWDRFAEAPLPRFTAHVYRTLADHERWLPGRLRRIAPRMAREDWLGGYATLDGVDRALAGLAGRARRANPLVAAGAELRRLHAELEADFAELFTDLIAAVRAGGGRPLGQTLGQSGHAGPIGPATAPP